MPSHPESRLAALLESAPVAEWQAQLAAAFPDAAAKQKCISAIREEVAKLHPDLGGDELAELQKAVVKHLTGAVSRQAKRPARQKAPPAPRLSGAELEEAVIRTYPYPIAVPFRAFTEQESPAARFGCLLDTFEGLLHFLATVVVSAYFRSGAPSAECNRHLLEHLLMEKRTTGQLWALLRDTLRLAGDCGGLLPYPELASYLHTARGGPTESHKALQALVEVRNKDWGHGTGRSDDFFKGLLPKNKELLEHELGAASWVARWKLVRPVVVDESGRITEAVPLMGDRRQRGQPCDLKIAPADSHWKGGEVYPQKTLLLFAPDGRQYLPLFPLSLFKLKGESSQRLFFLQSASWEHAPGRRQLRKAHYVAYEPGPEEYKKHEESRGEEAGRALEERIQQLEARLRAAGVAPAPRTAAPAAPAAEAAAETDPDCELVEVRHEQASHLRTFAGREQLLERVGQWLGQSSGGGYLLLLGPPGQGKSALMAELARREQARQGCLLHMVKSHRNPLKFVPALLSQAARLAQARFGAEAYRGDIDDLRNMLLRALEAVRRRAGRAVLVIDALDEMEATGQRLDFLPPELPEGVRVVLTCRPDIPLVQALRARLSGLEESEVPPLSETDLRPVLERRLGPDVLRSVGDRIDWPDLFRRMQGNPLFLQRALDRIARSLAGPEPAALDLDQLPANLEAFFRDIYNEIAERQGTRSTPEGRQKAKLLHLLCVAREPLDVEQLSELMAAAEMPLLQEDCRDRLLEMSQFLLDVGGHRFKPWHQGLVDFVRGQILGASGVRQTEELFCAWLRRPAGRLGRYGLRHRVGHLHAAGLADELAELMTDLPYLEAKAEAGLVYELGAEFHDAVGLLGTDHPRRQLLWLLAEALRSDIHFIARHPTTLFQCLWNRCWWYDCPGAEPHYEPPVGGWPPEGPPWKRPGPKLSALMEGWRAAKERAAPGFRWLRNLRPPPVPLGSAQRTIFRGHVGQVRAVAYSPDARQIVSGGDDRTVRVWDVLTSRELHCLRGHQGRVYSVTFSPDGRRIVSASEDGTLRVWDADGGEVACLRGHKGPVWSVAFAPGGRRVASASRDRTVRVWDLASGEQVLCLGSPGPERQGAVGHTASASCCAFTADGLRIVSGGWDRTVRVWDAADGRQLLCQTAHAHPVYGVAVSPDGRRIASASRDSSLRLWGAERGELLAEAGLDNDQFRALAFSWDGRYIATASGQGRIHVWDGHTLAALACREGHDGTVNAVAIAPVGSRLASGSWDQTVRTWNVLGGAATGRLRGDDVGALAVAFSPDGTLLATGDHQGGTHLWDPAAGLGRARWGGHQARVRCLAFAPDGRRLASGSRDNTVRVWDVADGRAVACLAGHEATVRCVAFAPDGGRVLSGSRDRTARLWDVATGAELLRLTGHEGIVHRVACDPAGKLLATREQDEGTIRVWDAADGRLVTCLRGDSPTRARIAFTPDGRGLVSRGEDGAIQVWDLATGRRQVLRQQPTDPLTLPPGLSPMPEWSVLMRELEAAFVSAAGEEVAWFPVRLPRFTAQAGGRTWAGIYANRLWLVRREGEGW